MKLKARFKYAEHQEYGSFGLAMVGRSWADPAGGMAVAHDMLEHFPDDSGTTEEELMALGASLYVRWGDAYYFNKGRRTGVAENLASEFPQQWGYMQQAGRNTLDDPGITCRIEEIEDTLSAILVEIVKLGHSEFHPEDFPEMFKEGELQKIVGWMRRGYRKAVGRFHGISRMDLLSTFNVIEGEVEKILRQYDNEEIDPWAECLVVADVKRCTARVTTWSED